ISRCSRSLLRCSKSVDRFSGFNWICDPSGRRPGTWMYYQFYEFGQAALQPFRAYADSLRLFYSNPLNPLSQTSFGRSMAAGAELFERSTRRYGKPSFDLPTTKIASMTVDVSEEIVWSRPFCNLIRF